MQVFSTTDKKYKNNVAKLYLEAFTKGESKQFVDKVALDNYLNQIFVRGEIIVVSDNAHLVAATLVIPLAFDDLLPQEILNSSNIQDAIYIAEMMVNEDYRGKGIGTLMLNEFFRIIDRQKYKNAFIRVWDKNIPALTLYKKMGFVPVATIQQTKLDITGMKPFIMNKIYLHTKLH